MADGSKTTSAKFLQRHIDFEGYAASMTRFNKKKSSVSFIGVGDLKDKSVAKDSAFSCALRDYKAQKDAFK